ncbi:hypothetical protein AB0C34_31355 [Nocardia sp. NPDC049220]|uniref:hypothetical protein n=1 Tax=Nocardia sp. NPDC049220 TaxID=3155273 RepID=UPI0034080D3E
MRGDDRGGQTAMIGEPRELYGEAVLRVISDTADAHRARRPRCADRDGSLVEQLGRDRRFRVGQSRHLCPDRRCHLGGYLLYLVAAETPGAIALRNWVNDGTPPRGGFG